MFLNRQLLITGAAALIRVMPLAVAYSMMQWVKFDHGGVFWKRRPFQPLSGSLDVNKIGAASVPIAVMVDSTSIVYGPATRTCTLGSIVNRLTWMSPATQYGDPEAVQVSFTTRPPGTTVAQVGVAVAVGVGVFEGVGIGDGVGVLVGV